jgi:hypothetical protein
LSADAVTDDIIGETISTPATRAPKTRFETFFISYFSSLSKRLKTINRYLNDTAH